MTDTTDIKALREKFETLSQIGDFYYFAKDLLDQLEAERQRSAGSEEELHKALHREKAAERKLLAAQEEIAALKGDQVPVAVVEPNDNLTVAEIRGDIPRRKAVRELYEGRWYSVRSYSPPRKNQSCCRSRTMYVVVLTDLCRNLRLEQQSRPLAAP